MKRVTMLLIMFAILLVPLSSSLATDFDYSDIRMVDTISRSNPVLIGQTAMFAQTANDNVILMTIADVLRGTKANDIVKKANMFNDKPGKGEEYILVTFHIEVVSTTDDSSSISMYNFDFVSRQGAVYKSDTPAGLDSSVQLFGGGSDTLQVAGIVDKTDIPYVVYLDGIWFDLDKTKTVKTVKNGTIAYTNCKANLRKETSTKSDRVAVLPKGTEVLIVGTETVGEQVWYNIEVDSMNVSGYIWDSLVDLAD